MYAVIFTAEIAHLDEQYTRTASRMRELAFSEYGCSGFTSTTEGDREIAISYWPDLASIAAWRADPSHREAQALGKSRWYRSYRVEVVRVLREYGSG